MGAASGEAPLSYQWRLNGADLPGATNPTLLIPNAQMSNSGEYTLVVTNILGFVSSRPPSHTIIWPVE